LAATVETNLASSLDDDFNVHDVSKDDLQDFHMAVHTIHRRSEGLIKFVSDFRNLTRIPIPKLEQLNIEQLIRPLLTLLKLEIESNNVEVNLHLLEGLTIEADKEQIEQVLINLLKNAIQALDENDELQKPKIISVSSGYDESEHIFIKIKDNGTGIDEEAVKKIFIPFFTTKKSGSGIGLSLSKQIMRKHGGNITVHTEVNAGTEFTLKFNK
jgi:signal transduction histidine kinase